MATPLHGLEFFRAGDYRDKNKEVWSVDKDFKNITHNFFEDRKDGKSVPIFWSPKAAHNERNKMRMGSVTNLQIKGDLLIGDGYIMDEFRPLVTKRNDGKNDFSALQAVSATFTRDKKRLIGVCLCSEELPEIEGLRPVYEAVFSGDNEGIVIEFSMEKEKKSKEKQMSDKLTFSEEAVELKVKNATEAREKELKIEFSKEIAGKDTEIKTLTERVEQITGELEKANEKVLEFSKSEKDRETEAIKSRVMALSEKGIKTPDECKEILERMLDFAQNENTKKFIEIDLQRYEKLETAVNHEFSRGKKEAENVDEYEVKIPEYGEKVGEK